MPTNPGYEYVNALEQYQKTKTDQEKLKVLQLMYQTAPKHKSSEKLVSDIKNKISKLRNKLAKEKSTKKGLFQKFSIKKEGAALICIVGPTNSGKSTLLSKLTNASPKIAPYEFTTKQPIIGIIDYHGIKLQLVEIPAIVPNFKETENGPSLLSILNNSDLLIYCFNTPKEKELLDIELSQLNKSILIFDKLENFADKIWKKLNLIKIYTKEPGKKKSYPPLALKKNSTVYDLALHIHKDFIKTSKTKVWARVWGNSVKFSSMRCSLNHILADDDIVELHKKK